MARQPRNGQTRQDSGWRGWPLLWICLLALALRLWLWNRPDHPLANDETEYLPVAFDLAHGYGFRFYDHYRWLRAPLYPLFLAFFLRLGGDNTRWATMAQVLLSTATVPGIYLLARRLFAREDPALLSALLTALLLPFATFPSLFMSETLFTSLLVAFFLLLFQVPDAPPGRQQIWAVVGGLALGLCALTRAVALAFLPFAAGWLYLNLRRAAPGRRRWLVAGLFALAALLTIAPWTVRNALAYGRFIPLDTGASYSLWAFYEPHETIDEINRQLEAIPNPADRQQFAIQKWRERLREDPGIVLRRIPWTFRLLFRIKPIEDRFLPLPYRKPSLAYFLLALLLDDGLYVLIAVASLFALFFAPAHSRKTLLLLWLLYNIAVMLLLHAEARYRQLLFPALIPYAGLALTEGKRLLAAPRPGRILKGAFLVLALLGWGYCLVRYSPWDWMALNLRRGFHQTVGQVHWVLGQREAALEAYTRALRADTRDPETCYDLGWALEQMGRLEEAAKAYRWGWSRQANYLPCSTALGNVLRRLGRLEEAREAFRGRYVAERDVVAWAWEHLSLEPIRRLDLGNGLDYGYVKGVHDAETAGGITYRWTNGEGRFRLAAAQPGTVRVRARLAAPRLGQASAIPVEVWVGGTLLARWQVGPTWSLYETHALTLQQGKMVEISLRSSTFVPREIDPSLPDTRALGVQVDWLEIVSATTDRKGILAYTEVTPFP
ncbi:MAG: glycosyltransferase family 39 protein [Chloroflexia bacterium]